MTAAFAVLWIATAIVFYTLVGYPILLALFRRRSAPTVRKDPAYRTTVTVIMAVYNGGAFLRTKLESLLALDYPKQLIDILVVSDGSTDDTDAIAGEYEARGVRLLRVPHGGKAAGLNAALAHATGELLFFTDVRQPLEADALAQLVANFADPSVGAATGELRLMKGDLGEQADMDLYWRYEIWARSRHSEIDSLFTATGCIYAIRRKLARPLAPDTISDDAVMPLRAFFDGYRVVFDPEAVAWDYPAVAGNEFRRRLRTLAGLWQIYARLPQLFTGRNRMRFHFLSHKFARLMLPWAILAVFIATVALPDSSFRTFLVSDELMLLAIALIDAIIPRNFPLKRLSSPARSFLVMNAAALLSVLVFFVPANRLWVPTRVKQNVSSHGHPHPGNP